MSEEGASAKDIKELEGNLASKSEEVQAIRIEKNELIAALEALKAEVHFSSDLAFLLWFFLSSSSSYAVLTLLCSSSVLKARRRSSSWTCQLSQHRRVTSRSSSPHLRLRVPPPPLTMLVSTVRTSLPSCFFALWSLSFRRQTRHVYHTKLGTDVASSLQS